MKIQDLKNISEAIDFSLKKEFWKISFKDF